MFSYKLKRFFLSISLLLSLSLFSQKVNNTTELQNAISSAGPGDTITLANGTWNDVFINVSNKNGTSTAPITINAESAGLVLMTGNSRVYLKGSYLTVSGLVFQAPDNLTVDGDTIEPVFELKDCDNCKIINNKIDTYNGTDAQKELTFKWILADGQHNEIAYNSFIGKHGIGSIINDNRNSSEPDYLSIHHNYFANRTPINEVNDDNDQDAIRIGNSGTSLNDSFSQVYDNYFYNFFGEVEMISNKSGSNKYYNNTFRDYAGSLTLRHGDNCEVYGNYFFAEGNTFSAGVRVIGENHKIYNNYIENVNSRKLDGSTSNATGGINVSNGRVNTALNGYYQVKNTTIINNTFVNCDFGLRIGTLVKSDLSLEPENLIIANNIMVNSSRDAIQEITAPSGSNSIYEGNITQNGDWDIATNNNNLITSDNLLANEDEFYRITNNSPAIDRGIGNYNFLDKDILDGNRGSNFDAGAEEFGANGNRLPYTSDDVGVKIGFGATIVSDPTLDTNINTLNFIKTAGTGNFSVIANIDWEITDIPSWISLNQESGSGITEITVSVTENNTGNERTGTIVINELSGGNDLTTSINIVQSTATLSSENAVEIPTESVTAVGTQVDSDNGPENTIDGDTDTRWSASSRDGSAFITFDLGCTHTLTDVSIFFHKSTLRTTTISIASSTDGVTYTNAYTEVASQQLSSEDFEDFDMNLTEARYIRIFGFGNSDNNNTSPWNSLEEVKFFGSSSCIDESLSISENDLANNGILIYPIPVVDNLLTISSKNIAIHNINIYNTNGQVVLSTNANGSFTKQINTNNLTSGIYFIVLDKIGVSKLIIK